MSSAVEHISNIDQIALQLITPSKKIIMGVFNWALSESFFAGIENVTAKQLAINIEQSDISRSEAITLWCYLQAIALIQEKTQFYVNELSINLSIPSRFQKFALQELNKYITNNYIKDIKLILNLCPIELLEIIQQLVFDYRKNYIKRNYLAGIKPIVFQHPKDRSMLSALKAIPFIDSLTAKAIDLIAKSEEALLLSNAILVTPTSMNSVYSAYTEACKALNISLPPMLYVSQGPINAFCVGADQPFLQINSSLVSLLNRDELIFVLGHELGHAISCHSKYHTLAMAITNISGGLLSSLTLGISDVVVQSTIAPLLFAWVRRSELTADRAGLIACQNKQAALCALMKIMGFPSSYFNEIQVQALIEQASLYEKKLDASFFDRINNISYLFGATHPMAVVRAAELLNWMNEGNYQEIIESSPQRLEHIASIIEQDSDTYDLVSEAIHILTKWSSDHFKTPRPEAAAIIRKMLYERHPPNGTALEPIMRIEININKISNDEVSYTLNILFSKQNKAYCNEIPVETVKWEYVPYSIRDEIIRYGGKDKIVRILYSI